MRVAEVRQLNDALPVSEEAVTLHRELAAADRDTYLPRLVTSLRNHGFLLTKLEQLTEAIRVSQEAIVLCRDLVVLNRDSYLPDLAALLFYQADRLVKLAQLSEAVAVSQEAVTAYQVLAAADRRAHLPYLAVSLFHHAMWLAEMGRRTNAVQVSEVAVALYQELVIVDRDAHLSSLAASLNNHGTRLAEVGQLTEAVHVAQEAVSLSRELVALNRDAYLPKLAGSLDNYAVRLSEVSGPSKGLSASTEAVALYRELANAERDAYLPDMAMSLDNRAALLAELGDWTEMLQVSVEAIALHWELVASKRNAYLPDLATSLFNHANRLAEMSRRGETCSVLDNETADTVHQRSISSAQAAAQEAADIFGQLAETNPDAYLVYLAASLSLLGDQLTKADRIEEVHDTWESAIANLPDQSSRLSLGVAHAQYLMRRAGPDQGSEVLARILTTPEVPGAVEAAARQTLRAQWRESAQSVERAWQFVNLMPLPDWIHLSDNDFKTLTDWISTSTWVESRDYFEEHSDRLLASATPTALRELALMASDGMVEQHRTLLDAVRVDGIDAAYRPLLLSETLDAWMNRPDWDTSLVYLHEHQELLADDVPDIIQSLGANTNTRIAVHWALLVLARDPAGIEGAYACLTDQYVLKALASDAITGYDAARIQACAVIESLIHHQVLISGLYSALALMLSGPTAKLTEDLVNHLRELATRVGPAERESAAAEFESMITSFPGDADIANQLRRAFGGTEESV